MNELTITKNGNTYSEGQLLNLKISDDETLLCELMCEDGIWFLRDMVNGHLTDDYDFEQYHKDIV